MGQELRLFAVLHLNVEMELRAEALQFGFIWSGDGETLDFAASGRVAGGMNCASAPFDEKRQHTALVVFEIKSFPLKQAAVRAFARAGSGAFERNLGIPEGRRELTDVAWMSRPADEARFR